MLAAVVASIVGYLRVLRTPDLVDIPAFTVIFTSRGISKDLLIWTLLILPTSLAVAASVWLYVGTRGQAFPLFFGWGLVGLYMYTGEVTMGLRETPGWAQWADAIEVLCLAGAVITLLLFPNGRWVPSWSRWAGLGAIGVFVAVPDGGTHLRSLLVDPDSIDAGARPGALVAGTAALAFPLIAQAIRYRWHATTTERQQTKWIMFGAGLMLVPAAIAVAISIVFSRDHPALGWLVAVTAFAGFVIPIASAIAVTKYRLYDLDHLVSRTVSYTLVGGLVTLTFVLGVVAVQALLPEAGSLAVAASTMASVAVFSPLRKLVQRKVDRRFNRARFDGEQESAAFAARLRASGDLDLVTIGLLDVLSKTVQPATVAIWTNERSNPSGWSRDTPHRGERADIPL
jgi:hypothetical protein